ncbi:IS110 family transposase, partial [Palleronia caenipelagi]
MQDIIGIDISKDQLDTYRLSDRQHAVFDNDKTGFKALLKWIGRAGELRLVYEPTGPYHRGMEDALAKAEHALVKVNPRQARRFAEATGTQAKTDRVDAMLLARMGLALDLPSRPVRGEMMNDLRELHVARLALVKERTAASNRASAAQNNVLKRQSKARLAFIERQLSELEEAITGLIAADPNLSARR